MLAIEAEHEKKRDELNAEIKFDAASPWLGH